MSHLPIIGITMGDPSGIGPEIIHKALSDSEIHEICRPVVWGDAGALSLKINSVEEKLIRGRPARVLSDGTVEAETDEGWMRFENLEHLEEYLDAMSPAKG